MVIGNVKYLRREIRRARRAKTRPASFVQDRGPVLRSAKRDLYSVKIGTSKNRDRLHLFRRRPPFAVNRPPRRASKEENPSFVQDRGPVLGKSGRAVPARCAQVLRSDAPHPRSWFLAREAELARRSRTGIAERYWPPKATGGSKERDPV